MLSVKNINAGYAAVQVLFDVSLDAAPGEITCLIGRNGAGKTTTLRTIMGLIQPSQGMVHLGDVRIDQQPAHEVPKLGVAYVPQGRGLFTELSVAQNLDVALMAGRADADTRGDALALFPRLRERLKQRAETLSGGEQQMLAMARALCLKPELLLLDEPTEGLQPSIAHLIHDVVKTLKNRGVAIVLVEQRIETLLALADKAVFLQNGRVPETLNKAQLAADPSLLKRYLGIGGSAA